jgi:hypothetical protein
MLEVLSTYFEKQKNLLFGGRQKQLRFKTTELQWASLATPARRVDLT